MKLLAAFLSSILFGFGLGLSGMTDPEKVQGFLNIAGSWKMDLLFVMLGAILVHAFFYVFIAKRKQPIFESHFRIPTKKHLDIRLVLGSSLFGIGWGLGGLCPGPAVASLFTLKPSLFIFLGAMLLGMSFYHFFFKPFFLKEPS